MENESSLDSLLGVVNRYNRFWFNNAPINHNIHDLKRTQDLIPVCEEADFYLIKKNSFEKYEKRVCGNIETISIGDIESVDIDTLPDFLYAETLAQSNLV